MTRTAQKKSQPCPECGGKMTFRTKTDELEYKGYVTKIRTKGWWCASCGEGILDADALRASERAFLELKSEIEGLRSAPR